MSMLPLLIVALLMCLKPAHAVITRADRDDAEYLELATRYVSAIPLPGGEGALIAPRWILTSAAVVRALEARKPAIDVEGRRYAIAATFVSPINMGEGVGLVFLSEAVRNIDPTRIYRHADEKGLGVVIVGHGGTGPIAAPASPAQQADRRARGAINTVDRVDALTLGLVLKGADEASDLQGATAPDERGAPAFVQTPAGLFVAGIALPGAQPAKVGDVDRYARVSAYAAWIDETMFRAAVAETAAGAKRR